MPLRVQLFHNLSLRQDAFLEIPALLVLPLSHEIVDHLIILKKGKNWEGARRKANSEQAGDSPRVQSRGLNECHHGIGAQKEAVQISSLGILLGEKRYFLGLGWPPLFQVPVKLIYPCAVSCCRCHGIRDSLKAERRMLEIRRRDISRRGRSCSGTSRTSYQLSFPRCSSKSRWMPDIQRRLGPFFSAANIGLYSV
ncbi:hypothetical protein V6N11_064484 [Hibiscus sabdariffa]|uniref:Uncharacterized protein n=1 Tax=Hibiscus sabdariffa TaxID=183260 RepID=A0ABR1ZPI4_9ROSI